MTSCPSRKPRLVVPCGRNPNQVCRIQVECRVGTRANTGDVFTFTGINAFRWIIDVPRLIQVGGRRVWWYWLGWSAQPS